MMWCCCKSFLRDGGQVRARTLSHESEGHLALMWWKKSGQENGMHHGWIGSGQCRVQSALVGDG